MQLAPVTKKERREFFLRVSTCVKYDADLCAEFYTKWYGKLKSSRKRGIRFNLPFKSYLILAEQADLKSSDDIGIYPGKMQLGRFGDKGPYSIRNCRFITAEQNRAETLANGGYRRGGDKQKGRTKYTHDYHARTSKLYARPFVATSPSGKIYRKKNLTEFCKQHNLNKGAVCACARGDKDSYKGWTFSYE